MDEQRKKGLCFNYLPPEISLHAITGTCNPQSMHLLGCWKGNQVLILVDSGSTHNFVSVSKVNVANGEQLRNPEICKGAPIELGFTIFTVDLFVLQLTGFDIILGVNWLTRLAPILWDFNLMWMSFFVEGKQVELNGINSRSGMQPNLHSLLPFVFNYGTIAAPLTAKLRKNYFQWTGDAIKAFETLKTLMFVLECDASDIGIGVVLLQENKPVAFFSRAMAARHVSLPAYEKKLIGLVKAIKHWQPYLWGKKFMVRTDHYILKFLLEQHSLSSPQQHRVSKLLPFYFIVEYKVGKSNTVADALSRRDVDQNCLLALSMPQLDLFDEIRQEQQRSLEIQQLISAEKKELLVHWTQSSPADASWEKVQDMLDHYPNFKLEDKLPKGTGSIDTRPLQVYTHYTHN
ncbi:hypothetical protein K2173_023306 [Erythroxylum novogranatense]|uniref:RNA-directed DNA polymerase n=1 Tax=Erythroxylum novogranatense TaxID=1862640 RepID=A0AAV8T8H2_9ROSI|nr:hypothetical protein K2173_023306 [Erythroxylum novogranatense]